MKVDINTLTYRELNAEDIDLVMELQDKIIESLEDSDILRKNDRELMLASISGRGISMGVFAPGDEKHLIALSIMVDAKGTSEDLSVGLERHSVTVPINLKSVMVLPEYRGNGLQRHLMVKLEGWAREQGYTHSCVSIHPKNKFSMNNAIAMGYEYDHTAVKYGGLTRDILVKIL